MGSKLMDHISARMENFLYALAGGGPGYTTCDAEIGIAAQGELCRVLGMAGLADLIDGCLDELDRLYEVAHFSR